MEAESRSGTGESAGDPAERGRSSSFASWTTNAEIIEALG